MMRYLRLLTWIAALQVVAACDDDGVTGPSPTGPTAVIRFINAVVDTGTVDFRFIDEVENLPTLLGVPFRGHSGVYQLVASGDRPTRVFPTSTDAALTSIMLVDTTLSLASDTRYTYVYAGSAGNGQDDLAVLEDPVELPTPGDGEIAVKALHVGFRMDAVDVHVVPVDAVEDPTPDDWQDLAVASLSNVSYLSQSDYINVPARATGLYRFVVTPAGSKSPLFATTPDVPGEAASDSGVEALPGVQVAGSVLTIVVTSGSVPGTRESSEETEVPTALLIADKDL